VIALATIVAIVTGTVVTGAGPHAGDEDVRRFGIEISSAARVHSISVLCSVTLMVGLIWRLRRRDQERREISELVSSWVFIALLQGAIGYIQYFNEIPALLVGIHVFGATMLWAVTVALVVRTQPLRRAAATNPAPATPRSLATAATRSAGA
jgi:cytochrome c oxidase assembly protein subunit 15